jgi:diacylglycerol O-acyltransferase
MRRYGARMSADGSNTLSYMDQGSFQGLRALGRAPIMQFLWIYEAGADLDGLRRFHRELGHGLLGRRIERSPLPFGRHRWVASPGPADIDVAAADCDRADLCAWADERIRTPVDPEHGPAWHLGVTQLTGGGTAVSLVVSHSVADALGLSLAITDAARGVRRDLGYPPPKSRPRGRALLQDGLQTLRAVPEMARAVVATARVAREQTDDLAASAKATVVSRNASRDPIVVPTVTLHIDLEQWDLKTKELGGTSNSMFAGFAARLGGNIGRLDADGQAMLSFPVSDRTEGDTRANALNTITVMADPETALHDLAPIRAALKKELTALSETGDANLAPLPLTPLVPKVLMRRLEKMVLKVGDPIGCSNLGELDPYVNRPDGTDADLASFRMLEPQVTPAILEGLGGHLYLASGRIGGHVFVTVAAWTIGGENTRAALATVVERTCEDFGFTATLS